MEGRKYFKSKNKNKENKPDVEWVSLPPEIFTAIYSKTPETSSRTSLKSVADYLLDTEEIPMRPEKQKSCFSPETSKTIVVAEKLVEDAEKLISELSHSTFFTNGLDVDKSKIAPEKNQVDKIYIRNIVASTLKKGYYESESQDVRSKSFFAPEKTSHSFTITKNLPKQTQKPIKRVNFKPSAENCEICKLNKKDFNENKTAETNDVETNKVRTEMSEEKPEKLNVQKGPVISIKGDLSVQSSGIVDIPPAESVSIIAPDNQSNIATFKICHNSSERKEKIVSSSNEKSSRTENQAEIENPSQSTLRRDICSSESEKNFKPVQIVDNDSEILKESFSNHSNIMISKESKPEKNFNSWKDVEEIDLDFGNFSLKEPQVLSETDIILNRQRKIIGWMEDTTRKFDKFLGKRFHEEAKSESDDKNQEKSLRILSSRPRETQENYNVQKSPEKSVIDYEQVDFLNEINDIYAELKTLTTQNNINKYQKDICQTKKISNILEDSKLNKELDVLLAESKNDTLESETTVANELKKKLTTQVELATEEIIEKVVNYQDFQSDFSYSEPEITSSEKSDSEEKKSDDEYSKSSSSIYTPTTSNAGFISNSKTSPISKDNNLDANLGHENKNRSVQSEKSLRESDKYSSIATTVQSEEKDCEKVANIRNVEENSLENLKTFTETKSYENSNENNTEKNKTSTDKEKTHSEEISQTTSQLVDSLQNIEYNSEDSSLQLSFALSDDKTNDASTRVTGTKMKSRLSGQFSETDTKNKSHSVKNKKLKEYRKKNVNLETSDCQNFKIPNESNKNHQPVSSKGNNQVGTQETADHHVPKILFTCNDIDNSDHHIPDIESIYLNNTNGNYQRRFSINSRSYMSMLEQNSSVVQESIQKRRSDLLKKLESCSLHSLNQDKQIFSSTAYSDNDPNHFNTRTKLWSESSSETHSEGEIRINSSASYSLGEVRRKNNTSESSLLSKVPSINTSHHPSTTQL